MEHRKKLSIAKKGKTLSEAHKRNLRKPVKDISNMKRTNKSLTKMAIINTINFSNEQLYEMKRLKDEGLSYRKIAELFNCSKRVIEVRIKNIDKFLNGGILYESK